MYVYITAKIYEAVFDTLPIMVDWFHLYESVIDDNIN